MSTNGHRAAPSREQIIREAVYHAAVAGWYDTSEAAQRAGTLTVSVADLDKTPGNILPPEQAGIPAGASHQFYIMVNATAYIVTRYPGPNQKAAYKVEVGDRIERQRQETALRTAVLDYALWYLSGEGAGYHPSHGPQAREVAIKGLLEEGTGEKDSEGQEPYPVIRDELPDIYLAPGDEASPAPLVIRQWSVEIGGYPNYCEVGLIGYNEDGTPELIAVDASPGGEEPEDGEADPDEEVL